jgi:hypothetical protein
LWSSEVIADMARSGMSFAASAGLHLNLPKLNGAGDVLEAFSDVDPTVRQSCLDVLWNVHQRRDVYSNTDTTSKDQSATEFLHEVPIYVQPGALQEENVASVSKRFGGYDFTTGAAGALLSTLPTARCFGDLTDLLSRNGLTRNDIHTAIRHLIAARLISIAVAAPENPVDETGSYSLPSALNRQTLVEDIGRDYVRPFSSPVAGSRVLLPIKERIYVWALVGMDLNDAWRRLDHLQTLFRDPQNRPLDRAGFVNTVMSSLAAFEQRIAPELLRLGILKRTPKPII